MFGMTALRHFWLTFICLGLVSAQTLANSENDWQVQSDFDYLPVNVDYNPEITTPQAYLGYPVGKWHVRHDQLVGYMQLLATQSDRMQLTITGKTHEDRPLVQIAITQPEQLAKLDDLQAQHMQHIHAGTQPDAAAPLILYMGYSVHGNEPSGSNAAMLIAYYLAAAQGPDVEQLLNNAIILLDPSLNPDGLSRFAQWANMHKGKHPSPEAMHREHAERFPSGRTNHYWFDLNRDWLLLTHPESKARVEQFQAWRPHVLTDFHEMGTHATYFFQPGVPARTNPLTGTENQTLTAKLGDFHANTLDNAQQLYFTRGTYKLKATAVVDGTSFSVVTEEFTVTTDPDAFRFVDSYRVKPGATVVAGNEVTLELEPLDADGNLLDPNGDPTLVSALEETSFNNDRVYIQNFLKPSGENPNISESSLITYRNSSGGFYFKIPIDGSL